MIDWIIKNKFKISKGEFVRIIPGRYSLIMAVITGFITGNQLVELLTEFSIIQFFITGCSIVLFFIWIFFPGRIVRGKEFE